jgi:hypothetical protein
MLKLKEISKFNHLIITLIIKKENLYIYIYIYIYIYNFNFSVYLPRDCQGIKPCKCPNISAGSHCLDIIVANSSADPHWLVRQRNKEVKIIKKWIAKYQADLLQLKQRIPV